MEALRTPDERFAGLPGWGFAPHYLEHAGADGADGTDSALRMHYVDEGPRDAAVTALCLHGEPSWAYLYRKMLPVFTGAGLRVVAPDFFGFGRSDKPVDDGWYSFERHRDSLRVFVEALDLKNILLVCQDWGGLIGLTLPMAFESSMPQRFTRLLVMNTGLGTGTVTEGFKAWRAYCNANPDMAIGKLMKRGCAVLTDAEAAAYDAPFPDARHKAGVRAFPNLVPDRDDAPGAALSRDAARFWSQRWQGESFMAIGMQDPVLGPPAMRSLHKLIRGCPPPLEVAEAGHFVQEWGGPVAQAALAHFKLA
ncbi:MAG: alpha/beta fold hydrolase [Burkholderiales bacterium]|nr:alpha/beta fold hydrolase [Burkholderiales bacterium]